MKIFTHLLFCAFLLPVAHAVQTSESAKPAEFPSIATYSLDKTKLNLPKDLAGQVNLLLISFQPEQQNDIDTWMSFAQALQHTHFNFRWYRMPVASRENIVFRWWENSSMRSDETDPETWPWVVPLYVDKDEFRRSLQIPSEHQVVALLVDKQGRVLWRSDGPMTPDKRTALSAIMAGVK